MSNTIYSTQPVHLSGHGIFCIPWMKDIVIGDGRSHPVSDFIGPGKAWANLAECRADYPHVTADTDELAYAVLQSATNSVIDNG